MRITITSIQLRSPWQFFTLANHGRKIQGQAKKTPGFVKMKNTGWGKMHYTLSIWDSDAAMKQFARAGAHLEAMKQSAKLSQEIRTYSFETDAIPDWKAAKQLLREKGKVMKF
jgi:hypothetical protein